MVIVAILLWALILIMITIIKIVEIVKEKDENEIRNNFNYYIEENGTLHQIKIKNFLENGIVFTKMENYQKDDSV